MFSMTGRKPTPAGGVYRSNLRSRARSLCSSMGSGMGSGAVNGVEVANSTDFEGGISDAGHRGLHDADYSGDSNSSCGDDDDDDDDNDNGYGDQCGKPSAIGRRNRRWEREEERRLLSWRRQGKPLAWIAGRLNRTKGALYLRWHTLQRST